MRPLIVDERAGWYHGDYVYEGLVSSHCHPHSRGTWRILAMATYHRDGDDRFFDRGDHVVRSRLWFTADALWCSFENERRYGCLRPRWEVGSDRAGTVGADAERGRARRDSSERLHDVRFGAYVGRREYLLRHVEPYQRKRFCGVPVGGWSGVENRGEAAGMWSRIGS